MSRRPAYMAQQLRSGEFGHYEDGTWYICTRTSARDPLSKKPVVMLNRVAIAYPSGRKDIVADSSEGDNIPVHAAVSSMECYEFGYSYAMLQLCPAGWKRTLGADWEMLFLDLIKNRSEGSYLLRNRCITLPEGRYVNVQQQRLLDRLQAYEDIDIHLQTLKTLQIAFIDNQVLIAKPSSAHIASLNALHLSLETPVMI